MKNKTCCDSSVSSLTCPLVERTEQSSVGCEEDGFFPQQTLLANVAPQVPILTNEKYLRSENEGDRPTSLITVGRQKPVRHLDIPRFLLNSLAKLEEPVSTFYKISIIYLNL